MPESVVLLHGFSGTRRMWDGAIALLDTERYRSLALDLPGHGSAAEQESPFTFASAVAGVLERSPERFVLCGYSLGGRIALQVALAAPERVERLVLVSTSAGIEDAAERAERSRADHALADRIESVPFEDFIEGWRAQPLFADDPPEAAALAREDQRRNRPAAIAAALRGLGTGEMPPLWRRLRELSMSATVLVGERDAKFRTLGQRIAELLPGGELTVVAGGHALALENPAAVVAALERR